MDDGLGALVGFGRLLRARGLPVGTGRILTFCRAAAALAPVDRRRLYWAGRVTLVARRDHIRDYDRAFDEHFGGPDLDDTLQKLFDYSAKTPVPPDLSGADVGAAGGHAAQGDDVDPESELIPLVASRAEVLRRKSFDELTAEERVHAARIIRRLAVTIPRRRARRLRPVRSGGTFDLRRTLRRSLRTHGEPVKRAWRRPSTKLRPLVLLLDVSGSMSAYSRALLQFGYAAMGAGRRVEVFCFGTRLTRVTRALRVSDPDRALADVGDRVHDWSGGTLIGDSVKQLIDAYGGAALLRGAVVVICSDGLERGDPDALTAQMARLRRLAHRIVWVNPLKGDPRYRPLARGMAAALPFVDTFLAGHNLASLEALGEAVSR